MTDDCKSDAQVKKPSKINIWTPYLPSCWRKTHSHTFPCNYIGFHGGILFNRKCLFNNKLKVSQAASLQEECVL